MQDSCKMQLRLEPSLFDKWWYRDTSQVVSMHDRVNLKSINISLALRHAFSTLSIDFSLRFHYGISTDSHLPYTSDHK